jgi:Uma2 family endonuclease
MKPSVALGSDMTLSLDRTAQSPTRSTWQPKTWLEYEQWREESRDRLGQNYLAQWYFDRDRFLVRDMGWEGMSHAEVKDLFILLISLWYMMHPEQTARSMSGGLLEKPGLQAASPDLLLYAGANAPQWRDGTPRRIDLGQWRVPNLVGEVADTTLASDLDEMKQIYAAMAIPEYWVVDVQGRRVLMFELMTGKYQQIDASLVMPGVTTELLKAALEQWAAGNGVAIGNWFMAQIQAN